MFRSAAGPFEQLGSPSGIQTPFQRLKPVCVELLSLTGRTKAAAQTHQVTACLRRLKLLLRALISGVDNLVSSSQKEDTTLASTSKLVSHASVNETALPPSLINYVFYPLSELISAAPRGIASLPDSVAELVLDVLSLLCSQWWTAWADTTQAQVGNKQWQVWCDLMILSSSVLGSPTSKDTSQKQSGRDLASDEVKLAAMRVLSELLSPRFTCAQPSNAISSPNETEWEWDGISELPSLDEAEALNDTRSTADRTTRVGLTASADLRLVYPSAGQLGYAATERVAKGAISFVLSSTFSVAESSQECVDVRTAAMSVARNALLLWIGGTCTIPSVPSHRNGKEKVWLQISPLHNAEILKMSPTSTSQDAASAQKAVAQRLRPLLPGITSSLTRLATSRLKSSEGRLKHKNTPSSVAVEAIGMLGDLFRATLSDVCLEHATTKPIPLSQTQSQKSSVISNRVTDLEDFAKISTDRDQALESQVSIAPEEHGSSQEDAGLAEEDARRALSTLAQVHLALKTFSPLTQPSLPNTSLPSSVHTSVQKSILRLAVLLLSECAGSFAWLDDQLEGMTRLNATTNNVDTCTAHTSINTLLTWIVDLASECNFDSVVKSAKTAFETLQTQFLKSNTLGSRLSDGSALWSVLIQALSSLPSATTSHNDATVSRLALRVSTALKLLTQRGTTQNSLGLTGIARLAQDIQQAVVWLIGPLKMEQLEFVQEEGDTISATWRLQPVFAGLESSTAKQLSRMFFDIGRSLAFCFIQEIKASPHKTKAKGDAGETFSVVTLLIERAARLRSVRIEVDQSIDGVARQDEARRSESLTSLVVATDMLRGVSSCLDNLELELQFASLSLGRAQASKQARKVAHKLGKKVFGLVMDMLEGDAEEAIASSTQSKDPSKASKSSLQQDNDDPYQVLSQTNSASNPNKLTEWIKGLSLAPSDISTTTPARFGPVLDLAFVHSADLSKPCTPSLAQTALAIQHRYVQAERDLDLSNALLFSLLGSASKLLGQSFRTLLLRGSYPLISGMSASSTTSSELVRQAAGASMRDIAFNTAYGDVRNCLMDHADYVLGSACQRLISGLDEELRAIAAADGKVFRSSESSLIRNGGRGRSREDMMVLPLVSAQRAPFVLVEMIRVLGSEIVPMVEDAIDEILDALDRFHQHPSICDGLLAVLDSILETMASEQNSKLHDPKVSLLSSIPAEFKRTEMEEFTAWLAARKEHDQPAFDAAPEEVDSDSKAEKKEKEDKPTKSQQVAAQILIKAISFLTHPSPILRTRVIYLLRHGIETLAPQGRTAELLPIINSAWPFIMTRLGTSYSISNPSSKQSSQMEPIIDLNRNQVGDGARQKDEKWCNKMEASFVERDPQVWVAASRFVESVAQWVPEFVGKRIIDEAWPRFEVLLRMLKLKFDPKMMRGHSNVAQPTIGSLTAGSMAEVDSKLALLDSKTHDLNHGPVKALIQDESARINVASFQTSGTHTHIQPPFILRSTSSLPAQLTMCIVTTLTTVVRHLNVRMPDEAAWAITTLPYLLDLLDSRQPPSIQRAAEQLYIELGKRNVEATMWALQCAFPKAGQAEHGRAKPCFMHHFWTRVHTETLHHVVESFNAF